MRKVSQNSKSFKERFFDHSMLGWIKKQRGVADAFQNSTMEEGGHSTRKGRGNARGLP
jgi:hypothetical protein